MLGRSSNLFLLLNSSIWELVRPPWVIRVMSSITMPKKNLELLSSSGKKPSFTWSKWSDAQSACFAKHFLWVVIFKLLMLSCCLCGSKGLLLKIPCHSKIFKIPPVFHHPSTQRRFRYSTRETRVAKKTISSQHCWVLWTNPITWPTNKNLDLLGNSSSLKVCRAKYRRKRCLPWRHEFYFCWCSCAQTRSVLG